jgi:hypothetical protein
MHPGFELGRGLDQRRKIQLKSLIGHAIGLPTDREATAGKRQPVANRQWRVKKR